MLSTGISETPIVVDVPEARVDGVHGRKGDEDCTMGCGLIDAIDAESHVEDDSCHVLAQVEQMWECIAGVMVSTEALNRSPYTGECGEETE